MTKYVQQLSQFIQEPCQTHWDTVAHVLCYLKGTTEQGLFYPSQTSLNLHAYYDANWASCIDTRRSISGFCIFIGQALIL